MRKQILLALFSTYLFVQGCVSDSQKESAPLPYMFPSLEALALGVVEAIEDSSLERLKSFCLTEQEYHEILWAGLPEQEVRGMPVEKAWSWVVRDVEKAARRYIGDFGGMEIALVKIVPPQEVRSYPTMKVHRAFRVFASANGGEAEEWRLLNVILEYKGRFKVIAYND